MALTAADYKANLQGLLPHGPAWPSGEDTALADLLDGLAQELARVDRRADDLLSESDPRTTYEMLLDWEGAAGLPDACWMLSLLSGNSIGTRKAALLARWTGLGGQSKAYFIDLAEKLGYPGTTITEYKAMTCGSVCTDSLNTSTVGWCYTWRLNLPETRISVMECTGSCADHLRDWGDDIIECVVRKFRPAHTHVIFAYGG